MPFLKLNSAVHLNYFIPASLLPVLLLSGHHPALSKLMAKSQHEVTAQTLNALICHMAGLPSATPEAEADLPLAAICCYGEEAFPQVAIADKTFLFADPVHLVLQRDSFSLAAPVPLPLTEEESAALLHALNSHFAADGLEFAASEDGHWYVCVDGKPAMRTHPPEVAIGRDIRAFLPSGPDAAYWRQLSNEVQMLLHAHPVNARREAAGHLPCNSLWFWGGGTLPAGASFAGISAYGSASLLKGLENLGLIARRAMPQHPGFDAADKNVWVVFDAAEPPHDGWFKAAVEALKSRRAEALTVCFGLEGQVLRVRLTKADLWKFWRKHAPLEAYCEK